MVKVLYVYLLSEGRNESLSPRPFLVQGNEEGKYLVPNIFFFPREQALIFLFDIYLLILYFIYLFIFNIFIGI